MRFLPDKIEAYYRYTCHCLLQYMITHLSFLPFMKQWSLCQTSRGAGSKYRYINT